MASDLFSGLRRNAFSPHRRAIAGHWRGRPKRRIRLFLLGSVVTALLTAFLLVFGNKSLSEWFATSAHSQGILPRSEPGASAPAAGEHYRWRSVAIGGGGFVTGMATDASGKRIVARTDVYGAYVWRADLDRWAQLVTSRSMPEVYRRQNGVATGVYEITVAPDDPDRLYMATAGALFHSADAGAHWERSILEGREAPLSFDPNAALRFAGPHIAVDPVNPDVALFGAPNDGAWRTGDGGKTWTPVATIPSSASLKGGKEEQTTGAIFWFRKATANRPAQAWAMAPGHGMFVSQDGGHTFSPLPSRTGNAPDFLKGGTFAADGSFVGVDNLGQRVWRYRDGAWLDLTLTSGLKRRGYIAVVAQPGGRLYLFDQGGRTFYSGNGGDSWWPVYRRVSAGEGDPPWLHVANLGYVAMADAIPDPGKPGRIWIASGVGPMVTDIFMSALPMIWHTQARGIEELVTNDVIQPPGGAPLFAAWDFGIHRKENLDAFSRTYGPRERVLIAAQQLDWSPSDPSFIVTNASDTRTDCCSEDGDAVMAGYSTDGGLHSGLRTRGAWRSE
ncbi:MAG: hypothetical protein P8X77_18430 [Maritimibacter sp.]